MKQPNKALEKVIKRKVKKIVDLENEYWKIVDEQRRKNSFNDDFLNDFEKHFPSELATLIYACVDGVVIVRHTAWNKGNEVQIQIVNSRLSILLKKLLIPINDQQSLNFSAIAKIGVGSTIKIQNTNINGISIDNLQVSAFSYTDEGKLADWEDAIMDIKLTILGLNSGVKFSGNVPTKKETVSIIEKLNEIKKEFSDLLDNAKKEEEIQIYLKEHPFLIQPFSNIYPKQKLGEDFITDFVFASTLDQGIKYTFVEIERASMPIFTKSGEFSSDFKHADKQTLDWDIWLEKNKDYLGKKLQGLETPNYLLIAGRSTDFTEENRTLLRAWNRRQQNMEFLTYDDIIFKLNELINNLKDEE